MQNYTLFIQLGLMFVVIYFFMIRPAQTKAKKEKPENRLFYVKPQDLILLSSKP